MQQRVDQVTVARDLLQEGRGEVPSMSGSPEPQPDAPRPSVQIVSAAWVKSSAGRRELDLMRNYYLKVQGQDAQRDGRPKPHYKSRRPRLESSGPHREIFSLEVRALSRQISIYPPTRESQT